ncbi:putative phage tail protein [Collimonas sp. H4R21]|uniref:Phage tail protein n=1 Tax=Collimonas rhizosphaerae TaxID=3126357 RepID=A0ABU9PXV7_9BURK
MGVKTSDDYLHQLTMLLPPGPAWEQEFAPDVHAVLEDLAPEFARVDGRANDLLNEMDPATVRELVPDWEKVMNLPDPCFGAAPSFSDRQKAVRVRLVAVGRQDRDYFLQISRDLGYPNPRITEHRAPRFGRARFGASHFGTWGAQFLWTLHLGERQPAGRRWGISVWGERFGKNPHQAIECVVRRENPAHTIVFFDYGDV